MGDLVRGYERLLGDAMIRDATLFAQQDVVEVAWKTVIASSSALLEYDAGTLGPEAADVLVADIDGWNTPR
jgi:glucose-6-phosphate 1-dehydrogenase